MIITTSKPDLSRGIRNNNWGNIRKGIKWRGLRSVQSDNAFSQFVSPEYGIRAMARILKNDFNSGKTLAQVINEYAPPVENNTNSYIDSVSNRTGIESSQSISGDDADSLASVIGAMVIHENGIALDNYHWGVIYKGIELEKV